MTKNQKDLFSPFCKPENYKEGLWRHVPNLQDYNRDEKDIIVISSWMDTCKTVKVSSSIELARRKYGPDNLRVLVIVPSVSLSYKFEKSLGLKNYKDLKYNKNPKENDYLKGINYYKANSKA
jgi:hypothetical protein